MAGLSQQEADALLIQYGYNETEEKKDCSLEIIPEEILESECVVTGGIGYSFAFSA
ncbi:MAG: hypothetical protein LIP01_01875 [Tannerellaceae bacterium]|nr:hypothetical protein [Tannerellaceae bacterium]